MKMSCIGKEGCDIINSYSNIYAFTRNGGVIWKMNRDLVWSM